MDVKRLNLNFGGIPSTGYSGSDAVFEELSRMVRGRLPSSYVAFIREADGGHPEIGSFTLSSGSQDNWFDVDLFYSWSYAEGIYIRNAYAEWRALLGERALPIGRDGGGNQIFLDFEDSGAPVWLYLHDEGPTRLKIASSFDEFIGSLTINPDLI